MTQHLRSLVMAASLAAISGVTAAPLLDFQFNEGSGNTTTDAASSFIGTLGTAVNPVTDLPSITPVSPSGLPNDTSVTLQGNGFLVVDDTETKVLALARNEALTIETWVNINPDFAKPNEGIGTYGGAYKLGLRGGEVVFTIFGIADITNSTVFLPASQWSHVAAAWEPGVGVTFYVNGSANFVANTNLTPVLRDNYLVIGAERFVNNLVASYDRFRIHRGALTAEQIDSDAANPKGLFENTLVAYNFDETALPAQNAKAPALPTSTSIDFLPGYSGPTWLNDTPTGLPTDFALGYNLNDPSVRQRIDVPYLSPIDLGANGTNYTLEAWVKLPTRLINERMVIFRTAGPGPRASLSIAANRTLHSTIFGTADIASSVRLPNDNRWHHIAVVVENFAQVHFHVDGVRRQTVTRGGTGAASSSGTAGLLIGLESDTRYFKGMLDRVRIHNTALTEAELDYPALPGLPRITGNPADTIADVGTDVTFTATATSDSAATYQWRFRSTQAETEGSDIVGANTTTLTLTNITAISRGYYSLVVSNTLGVTESHAARLNVRTAPEILQPLWSILPGERPYITGYDTDANLRDLERGMAYNPVTGHLLVAARFTSPAIKGIFILDPTTGAEIGQLSTNGIAGGTIVIIKVVVAEDGAIYAANFGTFSNTSNPPLRIYRWANESAEPTIAYEGNPAAGLANQQWGRNMAVRGAGADTQILMETRSTLVGLFTTTDGVNFTSSIITTDARSDDFQLGITFGEGDTFWAKNLFEPLYQWQFDATNRTATLQTAYPDFPGEYFGNFSFSTNGQYLAGLSVNPSAVDTVELYDMSNPEVGPVLLDTAEFAQDNPNNVNNGNVLLVGNRVFALNPNNGIIALEISTGSGPAPTLTATMGGGNLMLMWPASATGYVLESTDTLPSATWDIVPHETVDDHNMATVPTTGTSKFYRLRK